MKIEDFENSADILRIEHKEGPIIFVIGTCHVSDGSRRAVADLMRSVQPDVVVLELCEGREAFLHEEEVTLRERLNELNEGLIGILLWFWLLLWFTIDPFTNLNKLYVLMAKILGVLPGGEMKTAYDEAKKIPGTKVLLGDLPIELTVKKMDQELSFWDKMKFAFTILIDSFLSLFITAEQMRSFVMTRCFDETENKNILLDGRDEFLTFSLQKAAEKWILDEEEGEYHPPIVVGVVGAAHIPGIMKNWGLVTENNIKQLLESYDCDFDINKEREI